MLRASLRKPYAAIVVLHLAVSAGLLHSDKDKISDGQWYVGFINLAIAQSASKGEGVKIAVIDTGVDANHPSLSGSVLPGADFTTESDSSVGDGHIDVDGHGTGMASLIVGHGLVRGIAPRAKILPVRVKRTADSGGATQVATGINWAVAHGATIINVSLTTAVKDPRELAAVNNAIANDIIVVAAAGNLPSAESIQYPARFPGVIAVGAIDKYGKHSVTSVAGPELSLCAPGDRISMASSNGGYVLATGTSNASAIISGVVALVRSRLPELKADEVARILASTAIDAGAPGRDSVFGFGIVNPHGALAAAGFVHSSITGAEPSSTSPPTSRKPESRILTHAGLGLLLAALVGLGLSVAVLRRRT